MKTKAIEFWEFCEKVLNLKLTLGQRVIAKVAFGNQNPVDLLDEERDIALQMFGGIERVDNLARKYILLLLGRGSGKTTLCAAFAVYTAVTFDCSKAGPGSVPYVIVVAPDRPTAKLSVRMAKEMIASNPSLARLVTADQDQLIQLRRPDGRLVSIESFAATRGGASVRGRDIMAFIFDEAQFFTSNLSEGSGAREYTVNDKDIFDAMTPRLMPGAKGMLISTPWPVETLMGKMFEDNWQKCITAVAIKAPTNIVRGDDPHIQKMIEDELARDADNARRELFCETEGISGGEFFDISTLYGSMVDSAEWPLEYNPSWPVAVGCDLGFTRDSSAVCVVQFDGTKYHLVYSEELRPRPGKPLKPSSVIARFAFVAKKYGAQGVVADSYYRESLKEHLQSSGLVIFDAPEGTKGKAEVFQRTRAVLKEGKCIIPKADINKRMVQQAKLVSSKAAPGGTVTIKIPRKIGMGHGDIVSAWVLAVHRLAYSQVSTPVREIDQSSDDFNRETQRRLDEYFQKQQERYLKQTEQSVKKTMGGRRLRELFGGR